MGMFDFITSPVASVIGAAASYIGGERANEARTDLSREQMAFQERMSSTAWQRAVKDMQKAGLNPMLAYSQGPAASMPGAQPPHIENTLAAGVSGAEAGARTEASLAQAERTRQETLANDQHEERLREEINFVKQQRKTSAQAESVNFAESQKLIQEARIRLWEAESASQFLMRKNAEELDIVLGEAARMRTEREIDETQFGHALRYIERAVKALGSGLMGAVGYGLGRLGRPSGLRPGGGPGLRAPAVSPSGRYGALAR